MLVTSALLRTGCRSNLSISCNEPSSYRCTSYRPCSRVHDICHSYRVTSGLRDQMILNSEQPWHRVEMVISRIRRMGMSCIEVGEGTDVARGSDNVKRCVQSENLLDLR